ncbi:hypothetical protein [Streptomyces sp. NRRL B-24484]|uniref:hypothetical protein n=1 Tax=Streptomyces sp. NRRL B-24484 TaxID=1463833 RepID=UPI0004C26972|nr:hypothetical protein [Streptomyces sp. NRRL B-24484]
MDRGNSGDWTLPWTLKAQQVPHGGWIAGLLVDLAADARRVIRTVRFPLYPAARALGVQPVIVRTGLQRLADAGMVRFHIDETHPVEGPHVVVDVLPVFAEPAESVG